MAADGYLETIPSSEHVAVTHGLFRHHGCEGIPLGLMTDESELIGHSLSGKKKPYFLGGPYTTVSERYTVHKEGHRLLFLEAAIVPYE